MRQTSTKDSHSRCELDFGNLTFQYPNRLTPPGSLCICIISGPNPGSLILQTSWFRVNLPGFGAKSTLISPNCEHLAWHVGISTTIEIWKSDIYTVHAEPSSHFHNSRGACTTLSILYPNMDVSAA